MNNEEHCEHFLEKNTSLHYEKMQELKALLPHLFDKDGALLTEELQAFCTANTEPQEREPFVFSWHGKQRAKNAAFYKNPHDAKLSLAPQRNRGKNFDKTQNIIIEGENLEVLKLLKESYKEKIKCIYIDPPYNTGKDFIYKDNFSMNAKKYLIESGQIYEEGDFGQTLETGGRKHSVWLSMMYPRLVLARELLKEDGVIFVSIDDNEVHHLRIIMNEIFGEEGFVGCFAWKKRSGKSDVAFGVSQDDEYIICYAKNNFMAHREIERKYYETEDFPKNPWRINPLTKQTTSEERPNSFFVLINPKNNEEFMCNKNRTWSITSETFKIHYASGKIVFPGDYDFLKIKKPMFRVFKSEEMDKKGENWNKTSISTHLENVGMSKDGNRDFIELFDQKFFPFPKPTSLIKYLLQISTSPGDIILDFFAGSGTTGHAAMALNNEEEEKKQKDGLFQEDDENAVGNRRFILVQIPEKIDETKEAFKAGYKTIADITIERIKRASEKYPLVDNGFKVFSLTSSATENLQPDELSSLPMPKRAVNSEKPLKEVALLYGYEINATHTHLQDFINATQKVAKNT